MGKCRNKKARQMIPLSGLFTAVRRSSAERELHLDRDQDRHGLAGLGARDESPLPRRLDGFLVEAEYRIE
jgi:hypothetical protein